MKRKQVLQLIDDKLKVYSELHDPIERMKDLKPRTEATELKLPQT